MTGPLEPVTHWMREPEMRCPICGSNPWGEALQFAVPVTLPLGIHKDVQVMFCKPCRATYEVPVYVDKPEEEESI